MKQRIDGKPHGDPHLVPLPRKAVGLLRKLHLITGHGTLVFPGKRTSERPISDRLCVQRFWPWGTGRPHR
jgi:integrase